MNSNEPNKKCLAYLKMKGCIFGEIDIFYKYYNITKNNIKELIWYDPRYNRWYATMNKPIEIKLNELQKT